jgi:formate-dependent nitrite reductase membrane component NrfD
LVQVEEEGLMDPDLFLTLGIVLLLLTIPSLLSAWVEGRPPRIGAIMLLASFGMIAGAVTSKPGGYAFNDVPSVMVGVVTGFVN